MPNRTIPGTIEKYQLISFRVDGGERNDDDDGIGGFMSKKVLAEFRDQRPTDVIFMIHGWKGDMDAAIQQFDAWFGALEGNKSGRSRLVADVKAFRPYRIGLHWPSLPWGDEEIPAGGQNFAVGGAQSIPDMIRTYSERLGDTPKVRELLGRIFEHARRNMAATTLPDELRADYLELSKELGFKTSGVDGAPGDDQDQFNPDQIVEDAGEVGFRIGFGLGGVLSPLRQLSFWTMKKRACTVGESGMHALVAAIQTAFPEIRLHFMGHSFGCIAVSASICGPARPSRPQVPVRSAVLVQGALSIWAYCNDIPYSPGKGGYFQRLIAEGRVQGPVVTTHSKFDKAVGNFYPIGAQLAGQVAFAAYPKYGGLGTYGIQGMKKNISEDKMLPGTAGYSFQNASIYNLDGSEFICHGSGASGAHSDIAGPEVANVIWESMRASIAA